MLNIKNYQFEPGVLHLVSNGGALVKVGFGAVKETHDDPITQKAAQEIELYFKGEIERFSIPLRYDATPVGAKTLEALRALEYGELISYAQLAQAAGVPKAVRAVASACARNPLPILIPCHRAVLSTGKIGNYAGGVLWKEFLINLEHSQRQYRKS